MRRFPTRILAPDRPDRCRPTVLRQSLKLAARMVRIGHVLRKRTSFRLEQRIFASVYNRVVSCRHTDGKGPSRTSSFQIPQREPGVPNRVGHAAWDKPKPVLTRR